MDASGQGSQPRWLPQLPPDVWQHIARMALAAEDGDVRMWAVLNVVSKACRAGVHGALLPPGLLVSEGTYQARLQWSTIAHGLQLRTASLVQMTPARYEMIDCAGSAS